MSEFDDIPFYRIMLFKGRENSENNVIVLSATTHKKLYYGTNTKQALANFVVGTYQVAECNWFENMVISAMLDNENLTKEEAIAYVHYLLSDYSKEEVLAQYGVSSVSNIILLAKSDMPSFKSVTAKVFHFKPEHFLITLPLEDLINETRM